MSTMPSHDDANLILKLYDLRREEKMRAARAWFVANFRFVTLEEMQKALPLGSEENAYARMVATYWDMAASFVASGVLNQELFFESNRECLLVWVRIRPLIADLRQSTKDAMQYHNLETVAKAFVEWMNRRSPGSFEAFAARVG